jgi:uncharacterized protein (UPF0276 family)
MDRSKCMVGVNYTSSRQFALIRELIDLKAVDFVEILIDNFLTVPARSILRAFHDVPIAFHIMNSRFLESDKLRLHELSVPLKTLIKEINPLYVSDHVGRFSRNGCLLPILGEYDYCQIDHAIALVNLWQELLGTQILFENFPSYSPDGFTQPDFFKAILHETGAGLLFDISNAVIAKHNAGVPLSAWHPLVKGRCHFHAGGYSESVKSDSNSVILLDTHDRALSEVTNAAVHALLHEHQFDASTITIEFDRNIQIDSWMQELNRVAGWSRQTDVSCHTQ